MEDKLEGHKVGSSRNSVVEPVIPRQGERERVVNESFFAQGLAATGLAAKEAKALASYVLSSLEGAIVLSRAEKRVTPLERTGTFVVQTVRAKLSQR